MSFGNKRSGLNLKEAWQAFKIDSIQLGDLAWMPIPLEKVNIFMIEIDL